MKQKKIITILLFLLFFLLVYPINSEVSIDENVELVYDNITFKVSSTKTFDTIEVGSNYIQFNATRFYITAPNPTTITLNSLHSNINTTYDETVNLLNISTVTSGGNVTFNISSFRPYNHYKVNIDSNQHIYQANDTGFLSFYINSWSSHNITINPLVYLPNVTTNSSTGVEETNATLHGYLVDDGGEPCNVGFQYGTTTSYDNSVYVMVTTFRPNGNGDTIEWNKQGATHNWECVDDITPDDNTSYISATDSPSPTYTDLYEIEDIPSNILIPSITVHAVVRGDATPSTSGIYLILKINGSIYSSPRFYITKSYSDYNYTWNTNPYTGNNWTCLLYTSPSPRD